uniref:MCC-bdg_PDZ domain-containing protein n=2 Tax=Haemonchus TaxID=6288 RepID=A0A0N4W948_HAEPC
LTSQVAELRTEIEHLSAELEATGYEGLLHETRRSLMISMKDEYTKMKNELLRLRLANHALRIRTRNALETFKLTKP